jgi:hypothetical protein
MTEEKDITYAKVSQKITDGFIISEEQQRPGDMQGTITAPSTLVQTFTNLQFSLRPTLDLSSESYILINMPNTV